LQRFDQTSASRGIEALGFGPLNLELARHWLSLWEDGEPPPRSAIKPRHVKNHLPGIAIIEMRKDGSVTCRLAGSAIAMGLGIDPTGKDVIAITPPEHRAARLQRYQRVLDGAVSRLVKPHRTRFGTVIDVEDIQLPLGGVTEDGARQILYHADWRPQTMDRSMAELIDGMTTSVDEMYPITALAAA